MQKRNLIAVLVFLLTISFYLSTLSPSLTWGDGVRLQSEAISGESFILSEMSEEEFVPDPYPFARVGIMAWDHPLYIVLGYTLVRMLSAVDPLWLVNLISAIFGAASIALVYLLSYRYTTSPWASGYAALSLAVSHTFWWHSSTPEVYSLFIFLLLTSIYFFNKFESTRNFQALTASALFLGFAMTDHILAVLAVPALVLYLVMSRQVQPFRRGEWNRLIVPVLAFFAGYSIFVIQFVRLSQEFDLDRIVGSIVGSTFLNGLGAFSPILILESLFTYLLFLFLQFGPIGIVLGFIGMRNVFLDTDLTSRKIAALYLVYTVFAVFYRVTDQFAFFMTSHVFFALLMGIGARHVLSALGQKQRVALSLILMLGILFTPPLYRALPPLMEKNGIGDSFLRIPQIGTGLRDGLAYYIDPNKRGDFNAYDFGEETITKLAPNAMVIAEWYTDTDEYFILRYFHRTKSVRPDVTILGWPTEDPFSFNSQLVLDVVRDSFPERPTYLASLSDRFYSATKLIEMYCIVPENNIYRLYQRESENLPCLKLDSVTE